jgi:XTP/dITP diphosphohydrolase
VRLLVATRSAHKLAEIRSILAGLAGWTVVGLDEVGLAYEAAEEALEPFETFEENARSKARYFHERTGLPTVADDSGLVVDALDGAPGVRSKRFAPIELEGEERDRANNRHLLALLGDRPATERTAHYVCVVALVEPGRRPQELHRGEAEGRILHEERGAGGFGYDPLFYVPELGRTFAEIAPLDKDARSHRGRAFRALAGSLVARGADGTAPGGTG